MHRIYERNATWVSKRVGLVLGGGRAERGVVTACNRLDSACRHRVGNPSHSILAAYM
jgi:hypothetical protein